MANTLKSGGDEVIGKYVRPKLSIDASNTALIVVDMVNDYMHPKGVYGRNGIINPNVGKIVPPVINLVNRCKELRIPVIYARHIIRSGPDGEALDGGLIVETRPFLCREGLRPSTWGAAVIEDLPKPDFDIEKTRLSAFYQTNLEVLLRGLGTKTLLLTGIQTNYCVEGTARDAWYRDIRFVMVSNCMTCFDKRLHEATLQTLANIGSVATSEEVLAALQPK